MQTDLDTLGEEDVVIVTIGTPVDEYLDPGVREFDRVMADVAGAACATGNC